MMSPTDIQMLDVLHGDRSRRLRANRWSSEGYGRRSGSNGVPAANSRHHAR